MAQKSPMDIRIIEKHYSQMETEELVKLIDQLTSLTPEALLVLQQEFLKRGEKEQVLKISKFLASSRFLVPEERIINYLLVLRKRGIAESEIDKELKESFGIEQDYVDYSKFRIKSTGRENLIIGIVLITIPLGLIIFSVIMGALIGLGSIIILGFGVWRLVKGINLLNITSKKNVLSTKDLKED
jgi:hypothetical protein